MSLAPSVNNYSIGRGTFTFTPEGGGATVLGNVRTAVYAPQVTKKDHFSTQTGIRIKDLSVVSTLGATINLTLDEINDFNLAMYLLADSNTSGGLGALTTPQAKGVLTMTGSNTIGPKISFTGKVTLLPAGDMTLVADTDDWMGIPVSAEVQLDAGAYGVWTVEDQPTA